MCAAYTKYCYQCDSTLDNNCQEKWDDRLSTNQEKYKECKLWDAKFCVKVTGMWGGKIGLIIALRQQTLKHIRGGWSHYTDTSKPADGNGGSKYGHCPIRVQTSDLSITGPRAYQLLLPGPQGKENSFGNIQE
jgi:hypothetical protein